MRPKCFLLVLMLVTVVYSYSQQNDSAKIIEKKYKNVIRYNLGSAVIFNFDKAIIFGYERVVSPRQSFSINIGTTGMSGGGDNEDSIARKENIKNSGFNASADYRFYLSKENKYAIPHGVYIGPYYSYNYFNRENAWDYLQVNGSSVGVNSKVELKVHTLGMELGYQFVLWKRLALDFVVVGPGVSNYSFKTTVHDNDNLTQEQKDKLRDVLTDLFTDRLPRLANILKNKPLNSSGSMRTTDIGYRYLIHIGFLF